MSNNRPDPIWPRDRDGAPDIHPSDVPGWLPSEVLGWFRGRGWKPHDHQIAMVRAAQAGVNALLIAPTGGGKTLAGFLPTLAELKDRPRTGLHTLYISPLKALAQDIQRNLAQPIAEMRLPIRAETRTGDTLPAIREKQRRNPPHILMTTPESLALLLSLPDAPRLFAGLRRIIIDELHVLVGAKRGDLLALGLARLTSLAPNARRAGLSATVAHPDALMAWLSMRGRCDGGDVTMIHGRAGATARAAILATRQRLPWSGHMGLHAIPEIYEQIRQARTTLVFVNTRAQAELAFQELWRINDDTLAIALHHGSLAADQRRRVEAAMAAGQLRAVVATSSLDLGIDWAAVDLVVQIGAPKGVSRLLQRIGRSNHRLDEPSRALLAPANRFEVLECRAALDAITDGSLDGDPPAAGGLDVLAQHILGVACSAPFDPDALFTEVRLAAPYATLSRVDFDDTVSFVATGGYALAAYDRYKRLIPTTDGRLGIADQTVRRAYRMNIGTIVEAVTLKVSIGRGRIIGEIEEYFVTMLEPGDTFIFAGELLRYNRVRDTVVECSRAGAGDPKVPAYAGGRLPLSTHLADRVRGILNSPETWADLPGDVRWWLGLQAEKSELPGRDNLLVETFPRGGKFFLVAYCFEGRNAHQTLGMLLTRRMERMGYGPMGFVATDYVLAIWSVHEADDMTALFDEDMLGDDLEAWMDDSSMLRRTFRTVAVIAGLIERRHPGMKKTGRQLTISSDLIYDVLRQYEPGHLLLRATRADAARGLTDIGRIGALLKRAKGQLAHRRLSRISPLAVPVLLEIGRERVEGSAAEMLLDEMAETLIREADGQDD